MNHHLTRVESSFPIEIKIPPRIGAFRQIISDSVEQSRLKINFYLRSRFYIVNLSKLKKKEGKKRTFVRTNFLMKIKAYDHDAKIIEFIHDLNIFGCYFERL